MSAEEASSAPVDFIRQRIAAERAARPDAGVVTRFPPEPNGFLHIGHAKSICLNFGIAGEFGGHCFLRFDDTNPVREDETYVRAILEDVAWLGFDWQQHLTHASDYFERLHECALELIGKQLAYVDHLSAEQIREYRGTLTEPGRDSPHRNRSIEENLELFAAMRRGEFAEGECVLRARIDMAAPNINLRDPTLYRIRKVAHQRTGEGWCIYPMYDFAHTLSDAFEGITHSLCTLEFEDHRPLYDWFLDHLTLPARPRQIEFSRLNLAFTVTSKRKLNQLVELGEVSGWDDPRMPTLAGMRRRGYPPAALRDFIGRVGVTRKANTIEMGVLENSVREHLNEHAQRRLAVLVPLKVVLTNWPAGHVEQVTLPNHPGDERCGTRELSFGRELYIEAEDFMEDPPGKFHRLKPGGEVRLRGAYIIRCEAVIKDADGNIVELQCSYDADTRSGGSGAARKVKGTIHWVHAADAVPVELRLYDRLFVAADPDRGGDYLQNLNPDSLLVAQGLGEPSLAQLAPGETVQLERTGYFTRDSIEGQGRLLLNRTVTLRDSWARIEAQQLAEGA
jgi:glutaminyl-tRNA synthetase